MPRIMLRSFVFHVAFYLNCTLWFLLTLVSWPFPPAATMVCARSWAKSSLYLHELITGARVEVRGVARIPEGPVLVAAKHHSAWETMALLLFFPKATYIFKRELLFVPLFGLHLLKAQQVPINRGNRSEAMASITRGVKKAMERGRQVLIFPEGTRRPAGAKPSYRFGVARIYETLHQPCVPVAMTSGLAWPRNTFLHYPRRIILEFLEPIPGDLAPQVFFEQMQKSIEEGTNRLLAEVGFQAGDETLSRSQLKA